MFADERKLAALAGQMETPAYLFSEKLFADRAGLVKEAFGPDVDICFSIKANPFLLSFLPDTFAKVEVCSPGELRICQRIGIAPEKIIFSGVNKRREDIEAAVEYGCAVLTAESPQHLSGIERCAGEHGKTVCVLLRLTGGSQFGMDESVLKEILRNSGSPGPLPAARCWWRTSATSAAKNWTSATARSTTSSSRTSFPCANCRWRT